MDTALLLNTTFIPPKPKHLKPLKVKPKNTKQPIKSSMHPDPWSLSDDNKKNLSKPKPITKNPKNPLSDDNARHIIKGKARYLGLLRKHQGPQSHTPKWIKRTPEQMVQYLKDDRHGHLGSMWWPLSRRLEGWHNSKMKTGDVIQGTYGMSVGPLAFACLVHERPPAWPSFNCTFLKEMSNRGGATL